VGYMSIRDFRDHKLKVLLKVLLKEREKLKVMMVSLRVKWKEIEMAM
jgi:hypothetical protein